MGKRLSESELCSSFMYRNMIEVRNRSCLDRAGPEFRTATHIDLVDNIRVLLDSMKDTQHFRGKVRAFTFRSRSLTLYHNPNAPIDDLRRRWL